MKIEKLENFPKGIQKLGLKSWSDLVLYFPIRYEDESNVVKLSDLNIEISTQSQVEILSKKIVYRPKRMLIVEVTDNCGFASLRFIYFRQTFTENLIVGKRIRIFGQPRITNKGFEFIHPRIKMGWIEESELSIKPLLPIYPSVKGVSQQLIRRWVSKALISHVPEEWLPAKIIKKLNLTNLEDAIRNIHAPPSNAVKSGILNNLVTKKGVFWNRIKFDELIAQQVALNFSRKISKGLVAPELIDNKKLVEKVINNLPFDLTKSQKKVWNQVFEDIKRKTPCNRLIQGDVGSGKTVIAVLAVAATVGSYKQAAVMAPTEILARQLYLSLNNLLKEFGVKGSLLIGGISTKEKNKILSELKKGELDFVVGTQSIIQNTTCFSDLGLSIIDEQHRFGVHQRVALRKRGGHLLGMSATPIPRSLAMTFLADLDVSTIDEIPKGRKLVQTRLVSSSRRDEICNRIKVFIRQGGQVFWVCPMIDESKDFQRALSALKKTEEWLKPIFATQLTTVYGKQSKEEKEKSMQSFLNNKSKILLATTVIEVGIDIPNAGLIIIENAERFGLAQLHQLRGRVGRGNQQAMCILMFDNSLTDIAKERLKILYLTSDGFKVAQKDLELRGPGEILGLRQSGEPSLRYSNLIDDAFLVDNSIKYGNEILKKINFLDTTSKNSKLKKNLNNLLTRWARNYPFFYLGS